MSLEFVACPRCRRLACKCPEQMLSRAARLVACGLAVLALAALGSCSGSGLTIHLTWAGVWRVAKYVLAFGAGFAVCFAWIYAAIGRAIGSGLGW